MEYKDGYQEGEIIENIQITDSVYKIKISGKYKGVPGQFYMIKAWNEYPLLPRPLSICDLDETSITFLYLIVGKGTNLLSSLHKGDKVRVLGSLGKGFELYDRGKVAIIAGGIGIAPMLFLAKSMKNKPDLYCGFKSGSYFIEEMKPYVNNIVITTEDGSVGNKGYVTEFIDAEYDRYYACGPNPMMKSIQELKLCSQGFLSLEAHMACGIGACLGCSIMTTSGMQRVCNEGPVFRSDEVIFDA